MSRLDAYTCHEAFRRLDDFVDRELPPEEMSLVSEHLETCAMCADEFEFEAVVLAEVRSKVQRISAPPDLMDRIRLRLGRPPPPLSSP